MLPGLANCNDRDSVSEALENVYSATNSDNRGFVRKYLSRRFLNVSIVVAFTTLAGRLFQIFTTRFVKKYLASVVEKRLLIILNP